jgi:NAD(P)-dependent dehydrogenase (short-subunit alcohol dehydrogenase family)
MFTPIQLPKRNQHRRAAVENRVIIITGATAGIGKATALLCAQLGARVVAAARNEARGAELIEEIRDSGGEATFVRADMSSDADVKNMVTSATTTYGGLDYAFNNAGWFGPEAPLHEYDDKHWASVIDVNLTGVFRCMKHEIAAILATRRDAGGAIVNNASTVGHRGSDRSGPAYTAAKHAVIGLTRQAALSYIKQNIRVNAVSPGPTLTEATAPALQQPPEVVAAMLAALNPTGRLVPAEEIARTVVFLCSDAARMINGHDIPLDGGQLAKL